MFKGIWMAMLLATVALGSLLLSGCAFMTDGGERLPLTNAYAGTYLGTGYQDSWLVMNYLVTITEQGAVDVALGDEFFDAHATGTVNADGTFQVNTTLANGYTTIIFTGALDANQPNHFTGTWSITDVGQGTWEMLRATGEFPWEGSYSGIWNNDRAPAGTCSAVITVDQSATPPAYVGTFQAQAETSSVSPTSFSLDPDTGRIFFFASGTYNGRNNVGYEFFGYACVHNGKRAIIGEWDGDANLISGRWSVEE